MVRIINFNECVSNDGETFCTLEIQGGVEMVLSKETGNFYATAKKTSITSTFDKYTCQDLIGTELPGSIDKVNCEPYDYILKATGKTIQLTHKFVYVPESYPPPSNKEESYIKPDPKTFSSNETLQHA